MEGKGRRNSLGEGEAKRNEAKRKWRVKQSGEAKRWGDRTERVSAELRKLASVGGPVSETAWTKTSLPPVVLGCLLVSRFVSLGHHLPRGMTTGRGPIILILSHDETQKEALPRSGV